MRTVSYWAKRNTKKARLLIILSEVFLFILAVRLGLVLLRSDIRLPGIAVAVPLFIFSSSVLVRRYGKRLTQRNNRRYLQQRVCYFLVGLSMFSLTVFFVGSEKLLTWNVYSPLSGTGSSGLIKPAAFPAYRLSEKQLKKADRLIRKMRKHSSLKWLYVFLIIVGGLLLLYLIAVLSCSLSCNGNGALSIIVLLLGGGGVIFLCVWLIRRLLKGKPPQRV